MKALVDQALDLINSEFSEINYVEDIAYRLNCNHNTLRFYFSRVVGRSIVCHLNLTKCRHAIHLLKTTDWKLYAIARQVGYKNEKYFIKVFKKYYNKCPHEIRIDKK